MRNAVKIVTFNIRYDNSGDGRNCFEGRKGLIREKIRTELPALIGFQEMLPHMADWLEQALPEYNFVGSGRDDTYEGEAMTIAYRRGTAQLLALDTFWISPAPNAPGTRYSTQSDCPRICNIATIRFRSFSAPVRVYVTHLDNEDPIAREFGLIQVLQRIREDRALFHMPAILMGDFNAEPDEPELRCIADYADLGLKELSAALPYTFHGFGDQHTHSKIDYLFVGKGLEGEAAIAWKDEKDGIYLSDHFPLYSFVKEVAGE